tara:strand:+ start:4073 stop:5218 length:1146 start_codon:yes stop_codon:yes gene_type:complete
MKIFFKLYTYISFSFVCNFINSSENLLEQLILPAGFSIEIFADEIKSARQMAESSKGIIYVGSKSGDSIYAILDKDNDNFAESKILVASGLSNPTGVAFKDGNLFFSEVSKIWMIEDIDNYVNTSDHKTLPKKSLVTDKLPSDTWHGWKWLGFGPDGYLYVPVGAPCNICLKPLQDDSRFASIHRVLDDGNLETVASGVRNTVGFDWHPKTEKLYFSDNGRDWLGDDSPSCELNIINEEGEFFGYPYKHSTNVVDPEYGKLISGLDKDFSDPILELGAHVAPTGIAFYDKNTFPKNYQNNLFITLHGSWNRSKKVGYKVISVSFDDNGDYLSHQDFVTGWLKGSKAWGRPSAPFVKSDGSLLIADDKYNVIYRVTYSQEKI